MWIKNTVKLNILYLSAPNCSGGGVDKILLLLLVIFDDFMGLGIKIKSCSSPSSLK